MKKKLGLLSVLILFSTPSLLKAQSTPSSRVPLCLQFPDTNITTVLWPHGHSTVTTKLDKIKT